MNAPMRAQQFGPGETTRWPCLAGDYVLWMRARNPFAADTQWRILDFWATRDGDAVTVTNNWDDLPPWFHLHPLEVANSYCPRMSALLAGGYEPDAPTNGPGLWRVRSGDRVVRVGANHRGAPEVRGVPEVVNFGYCALAFGEGNGPAQAMIFGEVDSNATHEDKRRFRAAYLAGAQGGAPRCMDDAWRLG
ncbi:MAG: hypothetical protein ABI771_11020 [Betaproteobacteria bacterium]